MKNLLETALVAIVVVAAMSAQQPKYQQGAPQQQSGNAQKKSSGTAATTGRYSYSPQFNSADRDTVRDCMARAFGSTGLPGRPLPAALDAQIQAGAQLSAALQKRLQPLPPQCSSKLNPNLPANWTRALLGQHVLLLDPSKKISDMFDLD